LSFFSNPTHLLLRTIVVSTSFAVQGSPTKGLLSQSYNVLVVTPHTTNPAAHRLSPPLAGILQLECPPLHSQGWRSLSHPGAVPSSAFPTPCSWECCHF
jgi:hypothetical protein